MVLGAVIFTDIKRLLEVNVLFAAGLTNITLGSVAALEKTVLQSIDRTTIRTAISFFT
jgi:hypothetical protein